MMLEVCNRGAKTRQPNSAAATILKRVRAAGERYWRAADFDDLPAAAVAQTLSRLSREGTLRRVAKGLYYHPRATAFGPSQPAEADIVSHRIRTAILPAGVTAAALLGFTTQNPARREYATSANAVAPGSLGRSSVKIYTRRPETWNALAPEDGALLDFLRTRGRTSELPDNETRVRLLDLLRQPGRLERLLTSAANEPPRVRAMLGAIGQELGGRPELLQRLKESLNPYSRFDFGVLRGLLHAREWQAK